MNFQEENNSDNTLDNRCEYSIEVEPMTGLKIRAFREKMHLSREDFVNLLRACGKDDKEFKFSSGHLQRVELGHTPVTKRLVDGINKLRK